MRDLFTHTGLLVRLVARRERITIPVTVIVFVVINAATAASIAASYGDADKRRMLLAGPGSNAAFRFLLGPVDGADSTAALAVWRAGLFMVTALAVVAALTVVRHTRKEEELGRGELIRSAVTGPLAGPAAATVVTAVLCAVVAVGMAAVLLPLDGGTEPIPLFAVFCQYACTGLAAAGVALLAAQVATTAHIANRLAAVVILSGYLLRGVADTVDGWGWLRWVTPIGWAEMIEPYGANDLLPALACLVLFVVCAGAAGWVALHRDLGAGILTPRPGPAHAGHLGSIGAIAIRLHAPVLASWVVGIGAYALIIGFIQPSVAQLAAGNAQVTEMLRQSGAAATLTDLFVFTMLSLLAVAACGWSVNLAERLRAEETAGRTEVLLTTPLGRTRFHVAQLGLAVAGSIALPLVAASAMTLGNGIAGGGWARPAGHAFAAASAQIPAVLVIASAAVLLYAIRPGLTHLGWGLVITALFLGPLAGMFDLPHWARDLSPFSHTPVVPIEPMRWLPLIVCTAIAVALVAAGCRCWAGRDVG
ncbi:ABC transporter permease [Gordonia desulfuricans]|uniref:ABC transporter permease n=1 Tax=Gordonia desulfuricans TaxID=89051 RepID=A0A7K3LPZ9_9ACTN|nr:hypothetical protein [Gordonia desulfuricans]NDK90330.1 ABC transporter permease [Gordonia desulfuricans]